ncbi:MAG: hypothetical protein WBP33_02020 [Saprospiraceae bacterium]|nr:hypothetical protein [Candidatus Vicinibacter proximus]MCC6843122.1 hypothetical protein [Saprospiraceae bacterium]
MKNLIYFFSLIFFLSSCTNINKIIESGNYDDAISRLTSKLTGKKKKSRENVVNLEFAFKKAQERDLAAEAEYLMDDDENKWEKIYAIHTRIENRQRLVEGLLPLISEDGYKAGFKFINTSERKKESKANSAEYYYKSSQKLLEESKLNKDKQAAIEAYSLLNKISQLYSNYKDVSQLKKLAIELGTKHFLVKIINNTLNVMPVQMERDLLSIAVDDLNKNWKHFDMKENPLTEYDYHIILNLTNLQFSPEKEKSRIYEDVFEEEIEDVVTDSKGRPVLDSVGKEKKFKIRNKYTSTLEEVVQYKSSLLTGRLEWIHQLSKNVEFSRPLSVEVVFENKFAKLIKGDRDHLSEEARRKIKSHVMPFPSNETLLFDTGEKLKTLVKDYIYQRERE